jgi:hypothetical protein
LKINLIYIPKESGKNLFISINMLAVIVSQIKLITGAVDK